MDIRCSVEGCERSIYGRQSLCEMHYRRLLRSGDIGPAGPLTVRGVCNADGCEAPHDALGYCHGHYQRLERNGLPDETPLNRGGGSCSVDGCVRPHKARGYCAAHYKRVLAAGDPRPDEPIKEVDGTGYINHGYKIVSVPNKWRHLTYGETQVGEHRLVMALAIGRPLLPDEQVHHRNRDRLDNALENLELWSTSHPSGARVEDLVEYSIMILARYAGRGVPWHVGQRALKQISIRNDGQEQKRS